MDAKPYTRVGELIIAVNPFQWMPTLYSEDNRIKYVKQLIYNEANLVGTFIEVDE